MPKQSHDLWKIRDARDLHAILDTCGDGDVLEFRTRYENLQPARTYRLVMVAPDERDGREGGGLT